MPEQARERLKVSFGCFCAVAGLLLFPTGARADAGIPMLPFAYPVILVFLVPVIAIEAVFLKGRLHTEWKDTISATTRANLITMLLGFPLAWLMFLVLEMVLWSIFVFSGMENHIHWTLNPRVTDFLIVLTSAA